MKLYERLPDRVEVNGRTYRLDLDFRNVLEMLEIIGRDDLIQGARERRALKCVMKHPPRHPGPVLAAVRQMLFPASTGAKGPHITDFEQDADLIRAAFRQEYGINLYREKLHWVEFSALLAGLPEGSRYVEVLGIRARPMPSPTKYNVEERKWLAKAKAQYALKLSEKEQKESLNQGLRDVALSLLALTETRGEDHG